MTIAGKEGTMLNVNPPVLYYIILYLCEKHSDYSPCILACVSYLFHVPFDVLVQFLIFIFLSDPCAFIMHFISILICSFCYFCPARRTFQQAEA